MISINKNTRELREKFPYTRPSVLNKGPIFGLGYRSPWGLGNILQARIAKKYNLNAMIAQQSVRELERTKRNFQDVVDCATISVYEANLTIPWGADGDHLKNESEVKEALNAGCTHFTYDVSAELRKGLKEVIDKIHDLYSVTRQLKKNEDFTTEISLDETEETTRIEDITFILQELEKKRVKIHEIAPRFPGYFEKAIDYYWKRENGKKVKDVKEFENYLKKILQISKEFNFRVSIHSGSDKFLIYPIVSKILKDNFHLKTAGTYYLEELKIIARHHPDLFREIYHFSLEHFHRDRATYQLSTNIDNIPDLSNLSGRRISALLESGSGNDDLRQVMHVTYGAVLTARNENGTFMFVSRCADILKKNQEEYFIELDNHIKRHIKDFLLL